MDKAEAYEIILKVAKHVEQENMNTDSEKLSQLLGTIYGCMACISPDAMEDDRK